MNSRKKRAIDMLLLVIYFENEACRKVLVLKFENQKRNRITYKERAILPYKMFLH